jgi:hypothetical protein
MWLQVAMVANVLVAEREARIGQVEQDRLAHADDESGFANGPIRAILVLVAMLIVAVVGQAILV